MATYSNNKNALTIKSDSKVSVRGIKDKATRAAILRLVERINSEVHYSDISLGATAVSTTAAFNLLNGSQTGDGVTNRTGSSIRLRGTDLRFSITGNVIAVSTLTRVLVVIDKEADGLAFAATDLLTSSSVYAAYSAFNQMRFTILYDKVFSNTTGGPFQQVVCHRCKYDVHCMYNAGNAGTVADINTNSVYLMYVSDQAVNTSTIQGYFRTWFIDN